jgi:glycerophosphoryl diester phosphodiesterase
LILLVVLGACSKKEDFSTVDVFGHAGMGLNIQNSLYHDNTKEAVDLAMGIEGCDGVEVDVQLSEDGELWLYHDNELSTNTNGASCIPEIGSSELESLHYTTFAKEKLIRLKDLDDQSFIGKTLFLDLRHLNACSGQFVSKEDLINSLLSNELLTNSSITVWYILANPAWIDDFDAAGFSVLFSAAGYTEFNELIDNYPALDGLVVKNSEMNKEDVDHLHSLGKKVFIFEIRSPKGIRSALKKFPDGVITDDIRTTLIEKY